MRENSDLSRIHMQIMWNRLIAVVGLVVGALVVAGILAAPLLVSVVAPGFLAAGDKGDVTTHLTRLLWPFLLLVSLAALWMGMLNAHGRFAVPSAAPAMMSMVLVATRATSGGTWRMATFRRIDVIP